MKTYIRLLTILLWSWAAIGCEPPDELAGQPPTPCVNDIDCDEDERCVEAECQPTALTITTRALPRAAAGAPYHAMLQAVGGTPPYRWAVLAGAMPPGLRLDPATGALAGTPAAPGGHPLVFEVIDAAAPPAITQAALRIDVTDFASEVRQSSPIAWWRFDEPPGAPTAIDATGNGHDGTYSPQGVTLARPHLGAGDRAAAFTGDPGVGVTVPPGGLSPPAITLEALFQIGPIAAQARIIERSRAHSTGTQSHYGLNVDPRTRRVNFEIWTAQGELTLQSATPLTGRPVHVVATYDGAAARLYLDGALDAEAPGRGDLIVNEAPIGIANQVPRDRPLRGAIDELALYDRALTPEEVAAHFAALRPAADPAACEVIPWHADADGDLAGDPATVAPGCDPPPGYIAPAGDCDDTDPDRRPGARETCDTIDQDCDGRADEGVVPQALADCAEPACTPDGPACARCAPGHFIDRGACTPCEATCPDGFRIAGECDGIAREGTLSCVACAPIAGCLEVTCTDDADQTCARCADGFHPAPDGTCTPCAPIAGCLATRCTDLADAICAQCPDGQYIDPAGRCAPCAVCPDGQTPSGACDGTTRSDVIACAELPNLLQNGSFELPALDPGGFLVYPPANVFFWTLAGDAVHNNYRVSHPAAPCAGCGPTDGRQLLATGRDARGTHTIEQPFAVIQPDTVYTFSIDIRPLSCALSAVDPTSDGRCHGTIALVVPIAGVSQVIARSDDFAPLPLLTWSRVSVAFDSAHHPNLVGRPLHARIEPTTSRSRFSFDHAIATADATRRAAGRPSPPDGARDVHRDTPLDWLPATVAPDGHRVYLSRDPAAVARGDAAALAGEVAAPPMNPARLATGETWYWRVDALGDPAATPGPVWRFTVDDGRARDPMPAADGNGAAPDATLRWTPGPYTAAVDGHEVWFSADRAAVEDRRPEASHGRRTDPTFDPPGDLVPGRTYYWRVDERNGAESWPGELWSFVIFDGRGLAAEWRNGYAVWVEHAIRHVFPATRPAAFPAAPRVRLELARGEYESAQIITLPAPGRDLADLRVEFQAIDGPAADAIEVEWFVIGYLQQEPYSLGGLAVWADGAPDPLTGGWWPDLLLDAAAVDVAPEHAQSLWITVHAPPGTPPGEYTGALTLRTDSGFPTTIPLDVIVWDFTLPPGAGHLRTAVGFNELPHWGNAAWYLPYKDAILRHRINPSAIYSNSVPSVAQLERFHEAGMNAYNVIRDTYFAPHRAALIAAHFATLAASPLGRSLSSMAYFYGYDEVRPGPRWDTFPREFGFLEANYPDHGRLTTASLYDRIDPLAEMRALSVKWLCPPDEYYSAALGESIRDPYNLGLEYWTYHAYWEINRLLIYPRLDGWHLHRLNADGFVYYSVADWEAENPAFINRPIDPDAGPFVHFAEPFDDHGSSIIYPGTGAPIATTRLAAIRDGFEDYEYLWLLAARLGDEAAAEAASLVAPDGEAYTRVTWDPAIVTAARRAIAARLLRAETIADNPGFEAPGQDPAGWLVDGAGHRLVDAPDAIEGTRLLHLAPAADAITVTQPLGPVIPGARYAALVEARPTLGARGHLALTAGDEVIARSRDLTTLPPGTWASLAATFDAAARPDLAGAPLAVHLVVTAGAADLDDLRLTVGPEPAREPTPRDGATEVKRTTGLTWSPSGDAHPTQGHDLYFGTDPALVAAGDPAVSVGPQTVGRWHPPAPLEPGQTWYWRVDTLGPAGRVQGSVWSFTVNDGRAHTPSPADGADAPTDPLLRWLPGDDATTHRIWLGPDPLAVEAGDEAVFFGETADNQVEVGPLQPGETVYWRVDEVSAAGTVPGDLWQFTPTAE